MNLLAMPLLAIIRFCKAWKADSQNAKDIRNLANQIRRKHGEREIGKW